MTSEFYVSENPTNLAVGDRVNYIHKYRDEFYWSEPHEVIEVTEDNFKVRPIEKPRLNDPKVNGGVWWKSRVGLSWVWAVYPPVLKEYKEDQPLLEDDDL